MNHCELIGEFIGNRVYHVEAEVEILFVFKLHAQKRAVLVRFAVHEFFADKLIVVRPRKNRLFSGLFVAVFARKHDREKHAVLSVYGDHSVRSGRVIINAVALAENLGMLAHLNFKLAL